MLPAILDEFTCDLWVDDRGLWELTWTAAGRTGRPASSFVAWARDAVAGLIASGRVRLFVSSWPAMTPGRDVEPNELETLGREAAPWHDPQTATLIVLVRPVGEPPAWVGERSGGDGE